MNVFSSIFAQKHVFNPYNARQETWPEPLQFQTAVPDSPLVLYCCSEIHSIFLLFLFDYSFCFPSLFPTTRSLNQNDMHQTNCDGKTENIPLPWGTRDLFHWSWQLCSLSTRLPEICFICLLRHSQHLLLCLVCHYLFGNSNTRPNKLFIFFVQGNRLNSYYDQKEYIGRSVFYWKKVQPLLQSIRKKRSIHEPIDPLFMHFHSKEIKVSISSSSQNWNVSCCALAITCDVTWQFLLKYRSFD